MRVRLFIAILLMIGMIAVTGQWVLPNLTHQWVEPVQAAQEQPPIVMYMPIIQMAGPSGFFRSGQTFITWPEDQTVQGERYRIYRSDQPITAETFSGATLLGEVGKNSAVFYTTRFLNDKQWKRRYTDRLIVDDRGTQIPDRWGIFVWTLAAQDFNGGDQGDGYYAVTEIRPDEEEVFNPYAVFGPLAESVEDPAPVEITGEKGVSIGTGGHVYIQYMDLRNWNPTFHAPNYTNSYWGENPNDPNLKYNLQYAYDYNVFVPTPDLCGRTEGLPDKLPVYLHLHGWTGNTKGGEGDYPHKYCAYAIYPFDDTDTWWFGFAKDNDYRTGQIPRLGDEIVNFTEYRILRMIYDLERNPPGSAAVDQNRIYVAGQSMGGTGSLAFGERYPNVFAAIYASQPLTYFRTAGVSDSPHPQDWMADATSKWGLDKATDGNGKSINVNLPVHFIAPNGWADPLNKEYPNGVGVFDWENLGFGASENRMDQETAIIGISHGINDHIVWFNSQATPVYYDMNRGRRPWAAIMNDATHLWQYFDGLPPTASKPSTLSNGLPFWKLTVVKDETVPGFSNLSTDANSSNGTGYHNQTIMWSSSWNNWVGAPPPVDNADRWEMSFCSVAFQSWKCGSGNAGEKVDITLRRVQKFVLLPPENGRKTPRYHWRNEWPGGALVNNNLEGNVDVVNGVLTIPGFYVTGSGNRLVITPNY